MMYYGSGSSQTICTLPRYHSLFTGWMHCLILKVMQFILLCLHHRGEALSDASIHLLIPLGPDRQATRAVQTLDLCVSVRLDRKN